MGTLVGVTVRSLEPNVAEDTIRTVFAEMRRLEAMFSEFSLASAVSQLNAAAGIGPVAVPTELLEVLEIALSVARRSGAAFDPTWAALAPLWRLDADHFTPPTPAAVVASRELIDYRDVIIDRQERTVLLRRRGMRLGLGGVAKAYIAEKGAEMACAFGDADVLVDAGGDVVARTRRGGRPWTVAIRDPGSPGSLLAIAKLENEALVTSGDYERCIKSNGVRYHHLLDPRTGWPAARSRSATVIAPNGALADALATGLFVLGAEGLTLVSETDGASALLVRADGSVDGVDRGAGMKSRFVMLGTNP